MEEEYSQLEFIEKFQNMKFCILEGQTGLPDFIEYFESFLKATNMDYIVVDNIFYATHKLKEVVKYNPDIIAFVTTGMFRDSIDKCVDYLESNKVKPKEIWQITREGFAIIDNKKYVVKELLPDSDLEFIILTPTY